MKLHPKIHLLLNSPLHIKLLVANVFLLILIIPFAAKWNFDNRNYAAYSQSNACETFKKCVNAGGSPYTCNVKTSTTNSSCETIAESKTRHTAIAQKRARKMIIAHRGSWEFGPENTMASYLATMQSGADGNEIDVRYTKDGVLVMFHDDMLDILTFGKVGRIENIPYNEVRNLDFRNVKPNLAKYGCVPTFVDALVLHLKNNGLVMIDTKDPEVQDTVIALLDTLDMWDHVIETSGSKIKANPNYRGAIIKGTDFPYREDVNKAVTDQKAKEDYNFYQVDDPRAMVDSLGRPKRKIDLSSVTCPPKPTVADKYATESQLISRILKAPNWNKIPTSGAQKAQYAAEITDRANAIIESVKAGYSSPALLDAYRTRVRNRSIHTNWEYHGLDSNEAMAALLNKQAYETGLLIREVLWKVDPALTPLPNTTSPATWDWRVKTGAAKGAYKFSTAYNITTLKNYLALTDQQSTNLGLSQHDAVTSSLLYLSQNKATADLLMKHRRPDVRNRALLELMYHASFGKSWACNAIKQHAPHALNWVVYNPGVTCTF